LSAWPSMQLKALSSDHRSPAESCEEYLYGIKQLPHKTAGEATTNNGRNSPSEAQTFCRHVCGSCFCVDLEHLSMFRLYARLIDRDSNGCDHASHPAHVQIRARSRPRAHAVRLRVERRSFPLAAPCRNWPLERTGTADGAECIYRTLVRPFACHTMHAATTHHSQSLSGKNRLSEAETYCKPCKS
jgi:hypothetical protein